MKTYDVISLNYYSLEPNSSSGGQRRSYALVQQVIKSNKSILLLVVGTSKTPIIKSEPISNIVQYYIPPIELDEVTFLNFQNKFSEKVGIDTTLIWSSEKNDLLMEMIRKNSSPSTKLVAQHFSFFELIKHFNNDKYLFTHNLEHKIKNDVWTNKELKILFKRKEFESFNYFNKIFVCSEFEKKEILKQTSLPENNILIAPNGSNFSSQDVNSDKKSNDFECILLATKWPYNVEGFLNLTKECPQFFSQFKVNVVGSIKDKVKTITDNNNIPVTYHGQINDQKIETIAQNCKFAINPSFGGAGTNVKNSDYLALGLPVLCTDSSKRGYEKYSGFVVSLPYSEWSSITPERFVSIPKNIRQSVSWDATLSEFKNEIFS